MTSQPNTPLFSAAFAAYLLAQQARRLSDNYRTILALTCQYWLDYHGDKTLTAYTADDIRAWMVWLGGDDEAHGLPGKKPLSSSSVDIHYRNLKAFWLWTEREEMTSFGASPVRKVPRPKYTEKLPDVLTPEETKTLLKAVLADKEDPNRFRNYTILMFFGDTGVRLEELERLTWDNVNLEQGYCKVLGKGDRERIVKLGLELRRTLSKYRLQYRKAASGENALFTNDMGFRFDRDGIRTMVVRKLMAHVERKLSKYGPHTLRHTYGTIDVFVNQDLAATSRRMGHRDIATTKRYDHVADMLRASGTSPMDAIMAK